MVLRRPPYWWEWELEFSPHLLKRMVDRRFTEVDLRSMLHHARLVRRGLVRSRWIVRARHRRQDWEIIVEPDDVAQVTVVVTAYPIDG